MDTFLYKEPWVPYVDHFFQSSLVLNYPKNMIFTAQILTNHLKNAKKVYDTYPYAEKFDISSLNTIDWKNTTLVIDKDSELIIAPEPLRLLINLDKRLNHKKAKDFLFCTFQIPLLHSFLSVVFIIFGIYFLYLFQRYNLIGQFQYL